MSKRRQSPRDQPKLAFAATPRSRPTLEHEKTPRCRPSRGTRDYATSASSDTDGANVSATLHSSSPIPVCDRPMDSSFDLPDSTDWASTSLPAFEPLEAALRCEVCKEFYNNPVITSCNHTFCSICIRRCITADGKCPSCKGGCSSDKLSPNIAVREVVMRFQEARPKALELARADKEKEDVTPDKGVKRKLEEIDLEEDIIRRTRLRQTRSRSQRNRTSDIAPIEIADSDDEDDDFVPEGMAKCPICSKAMKVDLVFNHLDTCTGADASQGRNTRSKNPIAAFPTALQRRNKEPSPPPSRLSQLNYAMLKEGALRKKLQDTGIPSWGTKDLMRRRHIEWLNIHNSNCDADESVRKNKRQLLKELDEWEQTQGGRADTKESKIMKKDFDGTGYAKSHKTDFDDLIARARQQRNTPQPGSEESRPDQQPSELRSSHVNLDVDTAPSNQHPSDTKELPHPNPYENRESPLASIRAEVEQPNTANSHVPTLPSESSMDRSLLNEEGLQNPFSSQNRKVPMFALPEEAMRDVEGGTTVQ